MRDVLPFLSLMKEIEFVLKLKVDALKVLCSIFEKPVTLVTVYKDNQGAIAHGFPENSTSYESHRYQISSLSDFCREW